MSEAYTGEIRMFGFSYAPYRWAPCNGQLMQISQNDALFSLLSNTFGGDGTTTFKLPDLQNRTPIHLGQGPGLSMRTWGQAGGDESVSLTFDTIPPHDHSVGCKDGDADQTTPVNNVMAVKKSGRDPVNQYSDNTTQFMMNTSETGSGMAHNNQPPSLIVKMCICLQGVYPSRN